MLSAFQRYGFLYIVNHGIASAQVEHAFRQSAAFFDLPLDAKNALAWDRPESNRGYSCMGQEKVTNVGRANNVACFCIVFAVSGDLAR